MTTTHYHFIGIGGVGMSGIAQIYAARGFSVSGCDAQLEQATLLPLKRAGCPLYQKAPDTCCDHRPTDTCTYIYTSSISLTDPELLEAHARGHSCIHRSEALARLCTHAHTIAITGSHGKTTTTALIGHVFEMAQRDPTIVVGGIMPALQSTVRIGRNDFMIIEADESDRSHMAYRPQAILITNIDNDHLNIYKDSEDIRNTMHAFCAASPKAPVYICIDDSHCMHLARTVSNTVITYSSTFSDADWYAQDIELGPNGMIFTIMHKGNSYGRVTIPLFGKHNVTNALGAYACSRGHGIEHDAIINALQCFHGVERRFTRHGLFKGAAVVDDYGHHPSEIRAVVEAAQLQTSGTVHVLFQPQRYSRTFHLWNEFIDCFQTLPTPSIAIIDIYSAGEAPLPQITSKRLVDDINIMRASPVIHLAEDNLFEQTRAYLASRVQNGDIILCLGAGLNDRLAAYLARQS